MCSRCKAASFCTLTCQRSGWKAHKAECTPYVDTAVDETRALQPSAGACASTARAYPTQALHREGSDKIKGSNNGGPPAPPIVVRECALPEALARDVRNHLAGLPSKMWSVIETKDQPLAKGARMIPMRFHRLDEGVEAVTKRVMEALHIALSPHPHERVFVNFSKYEEGDFLETHTDTPSGNQSYDRRSAFVWHLSEDWQDGDGGLFVDEEAEGGPLHFKPRFNALVTFPVPRRHSVTKVTSPRIGRSARFASYGWVVVPRMEYIGGPCQLRPMLRSTGGKAAAILCIKDPAQATHASVLALFSGLPVEKVGQHHLGELCAFFTTRDSQVAHALCLPVGSELAVAVLAEPSKAEAVGDGSVSGTAPLSGCQVCADLECLQRLACLRHFIDAARKVWSPCCELDFKNSLQMSDMCSSAEVKVFVFIAQAERRPALVSRLDSWASALQPRLRIYLADPYLNKPVVEDYRLAVSDLPTAVADDTLGPLGSLRLKDFDGGVGLGLDIKRFRQWLLSLAKSAGFGKKPHLP